MVMLFSATREIDPETSARMLIASAQMTAQQRLTGADPELVERMAGLFIDAALLIGRVAIGLCFVVHTLGKLGI